MSTEMIRVIGKACFLCLLCTVVSPVNCQNKVGYTYDLNGNRNQRLFIGYRIKVNNGDSTKLDSLRPSPEKSESADKLAMEYGVSVYPNPTAREINVTINKAGVTSNTGAVVSLIDNSGKELERKRYVGNELVFSLEGAPPGNYYLRVSLDTKETLAYQIVKVN